MEKNKYKEAFMKYRQNLIKYGRIVPLENPDCLVPDEMRVLVFKIFEALNNLDMSVGYEYHDTGFRMPEGFDEETAEVFFDDFMDWYNIIETPSNQIFKYVTQNFSPQKYHKILCVGDGENSHLGRKLAMQGYDVVSVDPLARKRFSGRINNGIQKSNRTQGKFHVVQGSFFRTSKDMIEWADLIVGSKVPLCAEELVELKKPAVFNISSNAEIYNMRFKGVPINSSADLIREIKKCNGVSVKKCYNDLGEEDLIFVCDGRERDGR